MNTNTALLVTNIRSLAKMLSTSGIDEKYTHIRAIVIDLNNTTIENFDNQIISTLMKFPERFVSVERLSINASPERTAKTIAQIVSNERINCDKYYFEFGKEFNKLINSYLNHPETIIASISKSESSEESENTSDGDIPDTRLKGYHHREADIIYALMLIESGEKKIDIAKKLGVSGPTISYWEKNFELKKAGIATYLTKREKEDSEVFDSVTPATPTPVENIPAEEPVVQSDSVCNFDIFKDTDIDEETGVRFLVDPDLFLLIKGCLEHKGIYGCKDEDIWNMEKIFSEADDAEQLYSYEEFLENMSAYSFPDGVTKALYNDLVSYHEQQVEYIPDGINMDLI